MGLRTLVYIDNCIPSDVIPKSPSRQTAVARTFWTKITSKKSRFEPVLSEYVLKELRGGDEVHLIKACIKLCRGLEILKERVDVAEMARALMAELALPLKHRMDMFHVAAAAIYEVPYLVTSDKKLLRTMGDDACTFVAECGYRAPYIRSPADFFRSANPPRRGEDTPGAREVRVIRDRMGRLGGKNWSAFMRALDREDRRNRKRLGLP